MELKTASKQELRARLDHLHEERKAINNELLSRIEAECNNDLNKIIWTIFNEDHRLAAAVYYRNRTNCSVAQSVAAVDKILMEFRP